MKKIFDNKGLKIIIPAILTIGGAVSLGYAIYYTTSVLSNLDLVTQGYGMSPMIITGGVSLLTIGLALIAFLQFIRQKTIKGITLSIPYIVATLGVVLLSILPAMEFLFIYI